MEHVVYPGQEGDRRPGRLLERLIVALLARGHILVEGVPGLAKTMAIKTLAQSIGGQFQRIQFTPDLVPADLVGTRIYNQKLGEFQTSLGPVHTNLLLADEINRAPAKVQSALLEVMQERQVTIGRETHRGARAVPRHGDAEPDRVGGHLPAARGPARPVHAEGARRLPDADGGVRHRRAHDRRARADAERHRHDAAPRPAAQSADAVYVDPALIEYAVRVVGATRAPASVGLGELAGYVTFGASPRASINMILAAKALAFLRGRDYALPQDVRDLALDVLRHRLVLSYEALADNVSADRSFDGVLAAVPLPEVPLHERQSPASPRTTHAAPPAARDA